MTDELAELRERIAALEAKLSGGAMVEHLVAGRIDVVERDGTPRLSLSNAKQAPDTTLAGEVLTKGRERPGVIFYNEQGDECGGITYGGRRTSDGRIEAGGVVTMDRFDNDQIVALFYQDGPEGHSAGLQIVDRPEFSLPAAIKRAGELNAMPDGPEKDDAAAAFYAGIPFGSMRMLLGLLPGGDSGFELCDGESKPRIRITVPKEGEPSLRMAGRPEMPIAAARERESELAAMPEGAERDQAKREFLEEFLHGPNRVTVGLDSRGNSVLELCDGQSRPRIRLSVPAEGEPSIQVLDPAGEVQREV